MCNVLLEKEAPKRKANKEFFYDLFAVLSRFYCDCILNKQTNNKKKKKESTQISVHSVFPKVFYLRFKCVCASENDVKINRNRNQSIFFFHS